MQTFEIKKLRPRDAMQDAVHVLHLVRAAIDPNAIIAGGFARDVYLNKTPKDVDVWLHTSLPWEQVKDKLYEVLSDDMQSFITVLEPDSERARGWARWIMKAQVCGLRFDFICFYEPVNEDGMNVLNQFDIGLCAIGWKPAADGGGKFFYGEAFEHDVLHKQLTFNADARVLEDVERVVWDHLPRLLAKFPNYEPQGFPAGVPKPTGAARKNFKVSY